ncbi:MAG: LbtU family siderophore porin [Gammaproteobacteria bacterium]
MINRLLAPSLVGACMLCQPAEPAIAESAESSMPSPTSKTVEQEKSARIYRTREEQREAGLQRELTPWLTVSGLIEGELLYEDFDAKGGKADDSGRADSATLQLGFIAAPLEFAKAETILEYDTDKDKVEVDEAFLSFEYDPWELSLGKQYTPLGVYFSSFVTGPLLEFGETRANEVATLAYGPSDDFDLTLTAYRGRARKRGKNSGEWNWALATEVWLNEEWSFGLSYQSDLADSDERLLEDFNNRYINQVAGVSGYVLWVSDRFEITFEALAATDSFEELDADRNKPWAWNAEVVHFYPGTGFEIALRFEGSRELEDAPKYQFGPAVTWRTGKHASLTLEYLRGEFEDSLATTENDDPYDSVDRFGAIFSLVI